MYVNEELTIVPFKLMNSAKALPTVAFGLVCGVSLPAMNEILFGPMTCVLLHMTAFSATQKIVTLSPGHTVLGSAGLTGK